MLRHLPNVLTLLNLYCGAAAIVNTFQHNGIGVIAGTPELNWSVLLIGAAAVLDLLDGFVARLLGAGSALGAQLDSLADLISFGLAPALLLTNIVLASHAFLFADNLWMNLSVGATLLIPVFSALRLGIFNLDTTQRTFFKGLPTPANALFILSLILILEDEPQRQVLEAFIGPAFMIVLSLGLSLLLVAPLPLMNFKFPGGIRPAVHWPHLAFVVLSGAALLIWSWLGGPVVFVLYFLLSVPAYFAGPRAHD
jgi:CDP-diacylglycerol--serine O-phosphatidyltransferase